MLLKQGKSNVPSALYWEQHYTILQTEIGVKIIQWWLGHLLADYRLISSTYALAYY